MNAKELLKAMEWRYATKRFDTERSIPIEEWEELKKVLVLTPSSLGLQLWKFYDVVNPVVRQELRAVSWGQPQVTDAAHYVVFTAKRDFSEADVERYLDHVVKVRGVTRDSLEEYAQKIRGFVLTRPEEQNKAWVGHQVYIALGEMMTAAAVLGIDTCPLEGFDPLEYDRILGLEGTPYRAVCALALGYRKDDPYEKAAKVRYAENEVIEIV